MTVNFNELVKKNIYDVKTDIDVVPLTKDALPFENIDFIKLESLAEREKLRDFRLINLDFLSMTNEQGFPLFATFTTDSATCYMRGVLDTFGSVYCAIKYKTNFKSRIVRDQYLKHFKHFACKLIDDTRVSESMTLNFEVSSKFSGIIPPLAREEIVQHKYKFEEILVVAEADNWTFEKTVVHLNPNPDPLIIGVKKNLAYLISQFDITKLEDYVKREFIE